MNINENFYQQFAKEWVADWNDHNLDSIMNHYADNVNFYSPFVIKLNNDTEGRITGKGELRDYFTKALAAYPDLHFKLHHVLTGVNSIVLFYDSVSNKLCAESMRINNEGKVISVRAHYCSK